MDDRLSTMNAKKVPERRGSIIGSTIIDALRSIETSDLLLLLVIRGCQYGLV